jgi:pimeloyl-ACP methyl ester carboxylesterase
MSRSQLTFIGVSAIAVLLIDVSAIGNFSAARADVAPSCAALADFTMPGRDIVVRRVQQIPASAPGATPATPAHCRVDGAIDERTGRDGKAYAIKFAVALPATWNGRFLFQGGGGLNGSVQPPLGATYAGEQSALVRGFAVASTDSGHESTGFDASFFRDQQAALNFLYQAVADVTVVAKAVIARHYGKLPDHAYFVGCSTGGREAMLMSQRFPSYFDGIVAAAPATRTSFSNLGLRHATAALNAIAPRDADGKPQTRAALSDDDRRLVTHGLIFAPQHCAFDPATLACTAERKEACLSEAKVEAIRRVMQGPRTPSGRQVYPGYFYDTGIATTQGLPGILAGPVIPEGRPVGTTLDVEAAEAEAMDETVQYYERLGRDNTEAPLASWSRLFLVPGMGHCGGGERTLDRFDMLSPIVAWVESGREPERVIATGRGAPGESRPLCPYPRHAHYTRGDSREASNYICRE